MEVSVEKCWCGNKHCNKYWLKGIGHFVQGSGFTKDEAELIASLLNRHHHRSSTHLEDVIEFSKKMGFPISSTPMDLSMDDHRGRITMMFEELAEFIDGCGLILLVDGKPLTNLANSIPHEPQVELVRTGPNDLPAQADSLIDLAYFVIGTAAKMGLPWGPLWDDVHRANMTKEPGTTHRGVACDAIKPVGWEGPKTGEILRRHGYQPVEDESTEGGSDATAEDV